MSNLTNPLPEQIRRQLALTLGIVELALTQGKKLYPEEILHLRAEILKLYSLLRQYPELPVEDEEVSEYIPPLW